MLRLGVLRADCIAPEPKSENDNRPASAIPIEEKETFCWIEGMRDCMSLKLQMPHTSLINVMDRELRGGEVRQRDRAAAQAKMLSRHACQKRRNDMAITAGVDIGSTASKVVVLVDGKPVAHVIGPSTTNPKRTAREIYQQALQESGVQEADVAFVVGTGYGRTQVDFATKNISEITCHGRGAHYLLPPVQGCSRGFHFKGKLLLRFP